MTKKPDEIAFMMMALNRAANRETARKAIRVLRAQEPAPGSVFDLFIRQGVDRKVEAEYAPPLHEIADDLCMPSKRAEYLLSKWASKGWYEYGVSIWRGWLTKEGRKALNKHVGDVAYEARYP